MTNELACPNLFRITLTDPNTPDVQYEDGPPFVKPIIEINIRKASCYPSTTTWLIDGLDVAAVIAGLQPTLNLHRNIYTSFLQKWFSENMSKTMAVVIPTVGNGNPPIWESQCTVGSVEQTNAITYIKNTNCLLDGGVIAISGGTVQQFYQTDLLIPHKVQKFFLDIRAGRDFYDIWKHNYIDQILNSFKFTSASFDTADTVWS